jgi:hypothetical protein
MTELLFCDFWRVARVHDEGRNGVPESMKTASQNIEHVEDWPKPVFHDVVARRRPVASGSKQPTLWVSGPDRVVLPQNVCERIRQSHRRCTRLALCGLSLSVPRRAADVNAFVMKVDIRPVQAERFARTQSRKRQDDKERAPRFVCERENRFDLGDVGAGRLRGALGSLRFHNLCKKCLARLSKRSSRLPVTHAEPGKVENRQGASNNEERVPRKPQPFYPSECRTRRRRA